MSGTLAEANAPVGIEAVQEGSREQIDHTRLRRVLPEGIASTETAMLETVLEYGTARSAAFGQFAAGKTGTTSNYGDAWFVGWDRRYTVAVWVGFPNSLVPMLTEFQGGPVLGGTFPALIWHDFMVSAMRVERERAEEESAKHPSAKTTRTTGAGTSSEAASVSTGPAPIKETQHHSSPTHPAPAAEGEKPERHARAKASEEAPAPAQPSAPTPTTPASPAPTGAGGAPSQPSPPEAQTPKVSGGTGAPTGGASPSG